MIIGANDFIACVRVLPHSTRRHSGKTTVGGANRRGRSTFRRHSRRPSSGTRCSFFWRLPGSRQAPGSDLPRGPDAWRPATLGVAASIRSPLTGRRFRNQIGINFGHRPRDLDDAANYPLRTARRYALPGTMSVNAPRDPRHQGDARVDLSASTKDKFFGATLCALRGAARAVRFPLFFTRETISRSTTSASTGTGCSARR